MRQTPERAGGPALGNALGYFAALYLVDTQDWLGPENSEIAVAMMGTIFIHILIEWRNFLRWVRNQILVSRLKK